MDTKERKDPMERNDSERMKGKGRERERETRVGAPIERSRLRDEQ